MWKGCFCGERGVLALSRVPGGRMGRFKAHKRGSILQEEPCVVGTGEIAFGWKGLFLKDTRSSIGIWGRLKGVGGAAKTDQPGKRRRAYQELGEDEKVP